MVTNVREMLSVDLVEHAGIVVRYLAENGTEYGLKVPNREAHALGDMIAIALSRSAGGAVPGSTERN